MMLWCWNTKDIVGYKNNIGIGYKFKFQDPIGLKSFDFSLSYTPENWKNSINDTGQEIESDEKWHASFNYSTAVSGGILPGKYDLRFIIINLGIN